MKYAISKASGTDETLFDSLKEAPEFEGILPSGQSTAITSGDVEFAFSGVNDGMGTLRVLDQKFEIPSGSGGLLFKLFAADIDRDGDRDYFLGLYDGSEEVCPETLVEGFKILAMDEVPSCDIEKIRKEILKRKAPVYPFEPCPQPSKTDNRWQWGTLTPEQIEEQRNHPGYGSYPYIKP